MNKREDMLIVKFSKEKTPTLICWKKYCEYSKVKIRDKAMELIEQDLKKNDMLSKVKKIESDIEKNLK